MDRHGKIHRLAQRVYGRRLEPGDPIHTTHKEARRHYLTLIKNTKKQHWEGFLAALNEKYIWTAHHYALGDPLDGGKARIPTLKVRQTGLGSTATQVAETNQEKSHMLLATFFPKLTHSELDLLPPDHPIPKFKFRPVINDQIHRAISKLGPYKAPGLDDIPNVMLIQCAGHLMP